MLENALVRVCPFLGRKHEPSLTPARCKGGCVIVRFRRGDPEPPPTEGPHVHGRPGWSGCHAVVRRERWSTRYAATWESPSSRLGLSRSPVCGPASPGGGGPCSRLLGSCDPRPPGTPRRPGGSP